MIFLILGFILARWIPNYYQTMTKVWIPNNRNHSMKSETKRFKNSFILLNYFLLYRIEFETMPNNTSNQPEKLDANLEIQEVTKIEDSPILRNSSDGIVMGDLWGYISDVNQVIIDLFGAKDKKEFIGKHVLNFLIKEERQRAVKESMDSIINSKSKTLKYCVQLKKGQQLTLIVKTILMKDENGQQTGFVNIVKTDS